MSEFVAPVKKSNKRVANNNNKRKRNEDETPQTPESNKKQKVNNNNQKSAVRPDTPHINKHKSTQIPSDDDNTSLTSNTQQPNKKQSINNNTQSNDVNSDDSSTSTPVNKNQKLSKKGQTKDSTSNTQVHKNVPSEDSTPITPNTKNTQSNNTKQNTSTLSTPINKKKSKQVPESPSNTKEDMIISEEVQENKEEKQDDGDSIDELIKDAIKEEASDEFSFEDSSQSDSLTSQTSTDLSSSNDEFAAQLSEIKIDKNLENKMKDRIREKKKKEIDAKAAESRGVIYLGHLPYGFFEDQLHGFFSQFGEVTRFRLSRNKKSGKSKNYCFIEFEDPVVAQIVADTMDGYIMFSRSLKCRFIPHEKVHPKMFKGANKKYYPKKTKLIHRKRHNSTKSHDQLQRNIDKLLKKEEKKRQKLKDLNIDYNFPGYKALIPEKAKIHQIFED